MPPQEQGQNSLDSRTCREKCLKKYMKPDLREYRGNSFGAMVDYCVSAHYACCKSEPNQDKAEQKDIWQECKDRVSEKLKANKAQDD